MALAWLVGWWAWNPMHGAGYQFWSGIGSDLGELTIVAAIATPAIMFYRRNNCHVKRCWRLQWHRHPETGHPVCHHHHPHDAALDVLPSQRGPSSA